MRIAVLADIHANWHALQAVLMDIEARAPDAVFVGGDIVNRGTRPRECLDLILEKMRHHGWQVIRGNHEDYVLSEARRPSGRPDWLVRVCRHSQWTCELLTDRLDAIAVLPEQLDHTTPSGHHLRVVHASMRGNRVGLYEGMADDELHELVAPSPDILCAGHTHMPFIRRLNRYLVMNVGAVGMPFDGDLRASYGVLELRREHWHAEIVRLNYDREAAAKDFVDSGYLDQGGPMAPLIFWEFQKARPLLSRWHRECEPLVSSGVLAMDASVRELLARV